MGFCCFGCVFCLFVCILHLPLSWRRLERSHLRIIIYGMHFRICFKLKCPEIVYGTNGQNKLSQRSRSRDFHSAILKELRSGTGDCHVQLLSSNYFVPEACQLTRAATDFKEEFRQIQKTAV